MIQNVLNVSSLHVTGKSSQVLVMPKVRGIKNKPLPKAIAVVWKNRSLVREVFGKWVDTVHEAQFAKSLASGSKQMMGICR